MAQEQQRLDPALRHTQTLTPISPASTLSQYPPQYQQPATATLDNLYSKSPSSAVDFSGDCDAHYGSLENDGTGDGSTKRLRACEACRGLKVRCDPNPTNPGGPCKRCAKANRNCVITQPSRKRQKKTDSRVTELENKINSLTATLKATGGDAIVNALEPQVMRVAAQIPYQRTQSNEYGAQFNVSGRASGDWGGYKPITPPMVLAGQKRKHAGSRESTTPDTRSLSISGRNGCIPAGYGFNDAAPETVSQHGKAPLTHNYADVVDRGLVTSEMATKMFNHYVERMAPHMPAVVFSPATTAAEVRKAKPTLFLAILSVSSGMNYPDLQRMLTKEIMAIYGERIITNGEKTLEIIQALHVNTLWYWPPEHFEELKFYQLVHIAAVMAIDIGIGKKSKSAKMNKHAGLWREHPWRKTPYLDPEGIEARRAWLSCYFLCCNAAMGLRRLNLIRWSTFMADCVNVLENSPEAAHSDKTLCQWVRSQKITEEVGTQFSMDDPSANVSVTDPKMQYFMKAFEKDLDNWSNQISAGVQSPALIMAKHVVNLYMHEIAIQTDPLGDPDDAGGTNFSIPEQLTPAHIDALLTCLKSIEGTFEIFLKFDVDTIRCFPVAHFVRIAYAVVILIKMYFAAASPNSELGKVINKDSMKVEYYLDNLVALFKASAAQEKSRPAAKFLTVLIMLKTWFHRQREHQSPPAGEVPVATHMPHEPVAVGTPNLANQQRRPQSSYGVANTPLQLLSEVATGDSRAQPRAGTVNHYLNNQNNWSSLDEASHQQNQGSGDFNGPTMDPSLNSDFVYNMGDGFEQAMGMTLGGGDFGAYFNDDPFFGSLMDSVGAAPGWDGF
ncbi:hypothetical protein BJ878DRAFT_499019 [Calycina marina]|uniref:Zn(2)-C6 fungal-type domain-containing protein n=1 Tax=Calycina marina TaxID=1763456 RepID=A0A9P7Z607_9HELO|nr:hypothetical protein BJ878DRAFT_499019 [Calycina marina]